LFGSFGLVIERADNRGVNSFYFVSLIELDFYGVSCEKLQTIEYRCDCIEILVNKFDATDFVLRLDTNGGFLARVCKLVNKSIVVGDQIELPDYFKSYFGEFLYFIWHSNRADENWNKVSLAY
jgi:hypothetical protein